jgi:hypothetical protein
MLDAAIMAWGRMAGGAQAPIGSFLNLRTMAVFQQTGDGALPQSGWWHYISSNGSLALSGVATIVNTALGTSYTSANFHAYTSADLAAYPGTGAQDA